MAKFNFGNVALKNNVDEKETGVEVNSAPVVEEQKSEMHTKEEVTKPVAENKIDIKDIQAVTQTAIDKMLKIEEELNNSFIERNREIRMLLLALVSGTNAFMHGKPGTGKSALTEALAERINYAEYFRWLLSKTTEPGEIFGVNSIESMKKDIFKYNTKGKLPEAHIAFLDETFKANSAILNSLLTIMNEKIFFNDGVQQVPLISLIGASNEYPESDELNALYDRFLLRWSVNYIKENSNKVKMLDMFLKNRNTTSIYSNKKATVSPKTFIDIEMIKILNEKAKEVTCTKKTLQVYNKLLNELEKNGIEISDRRKNESLKVVQANALLNGHKQIAIEDFECLIYTLWNTEDQIQIVYDAVAKMSNPIRDTIINFNKSIAEYKKKLDDLDPDANDYATQKILIWTENSKNIRFANETVTKLIQNLEEEGKTNTTEYIDLRKLQTDIKEFIDVLKEGIPSL